MIYINLDRDINNLPQRAVFNGLYWLPQVKQVILKTIYGVYQDDDFTYGSKELELVATNTTWVDPKNGNIVPEGTPGAIGEYDYFEIIATTQPVIISDLIIHYMNVAKQNGRYS